MTREEKCKLLISKGYTYNKITGDVIGIKGKPIKRKSKGYIQINFRHDGKHYRLYAHQYAYYYIFGLIVDVIDHRDLDRENNKIDNLRSVTVQENSFNSKAKGYNWCNNRWRAKIFINGKQIHIGYFDIEEDAKQAYLNAKKIYHKID